MLHDAWGVCYIVCMSYAPLMAKEQNLNIRMDEAEITALKAAAADDDRPYSALARRILSAWLREKGWLKDPSK